MMRLLGISLAVYIGSTCLLMPEIAQADTASTTAVCMFKWPSDKEAREACLLLNAKAHERLMSETNEAFAREVVTFCQIQGEDDADDVLGCLMRQRRATYRFNELLGRKVGPAIMVIRDRATKDCMDRHYPDVLTVTHCIERAIRN